MASSAPCRCERCQQTFGIYQILVVGDFQHRLESHFQSSQTPVQPDPWTDHQTFQKCQIYERLYCHLRTKCKRNSALGQQCRGGIQNNVKNDTWNFSCPGKVCFFSFWVLLFWLQPIMVQKFLPIKLWNFYPLWFFIMILTYKLRQPIGPETAVWKT